MNSATNYPTRAQVEALITSATNGLSAGGSGTGIGTNVNAFYITNSLTLGGLVISNNGSQIYYDAPVNAPQFTGGGAGLTDINAAANSLATVTALAGVSNSIPAEATQVEVEAGTVTNKYVSPSTLAGIVAITNGWPQAEGLPFVLWNTFGTPNTNIIFGTNGPAAARNGFYTWNPTFNGWTNVAILITNHGPNIYTLHAGVASAASWSNGTSLTSGPWINLAAGTNLLFTTWHTTNIWNVQTYGAVTNHLDFTNGIGGLVYSNGASWQVTSRVNSTNQNWLLLLNAP
jgi:hypothetical protein